MQIRYIEPSDDRLEISRVYERSWKYAYKGIIPQDYLNSISEGRWVSNFNAPGLNTLLCIDGGVIAGTSSFSAEPRFERFAGWGEIISLYMLPEYVGKGYGKHLLTSAIAELKKLGRDKIFLWVLEENICARGFYEHTGFSKSDDCLNINIGGRDLREIRYIYEK